MKDPKIAPMCDELGTLEKELAPFKPKLDRIEMLRKALRAAADRLYKPNELVLFEGDRFDYIAGVKGRERRITSMSKLFTAFGKREFLKRCSMALKHLEELGKGLDLLEWSNSGPRSLKCVERGIPAGDRADEIATMRLAHIEKPVSAIDDAMKAIERSRKRAA